MVWSSRQRPHHGFYIYVSEIKIDVDGIHASRWHSNFGHHANMQLIKTLTNNYANATLKRWEHDFTRNRGGIFKPLIQ